MLNPRSLTGSASKSADGVCRRVLPQRQKTTEVRPVRPRIIRNSYSLSMITTVAAIGSSTITSRWRLLSSLAITDSETSIHSQLHRRFLGLLVFEFTQVAPARVLVSDCKDQKSCPSVHSACHRSRDLHFPFVRSRLPPNSRLHLLQSVRRRLCSTLPRS